MSWVAVGLAGAGALLQSRAAQRKEENQKRNNLAQAELTRYSPWTGVHGQLDSSYVPGQLEAGVGGAIQGAAIGQAFGKLGSPQQPAPGAPMAGNPMDQQQMQSPWNQDFMNPQRNMTA